MLGKYRCTETEGASENPRDTTDHQQQEATSAVNAVSSTPTPPDDCQAQLDDNDYDTEATESELALSEPAASPSPPVHDEFSDRRATGE